MQSNYSPSINIIRDAGRNFSYITTPNSTRALNQIVDDFRKGIRAFSIIGSYGTGKSSFLLAFEQTLLGKKTFFKSSFLRSQKVGVLKIVGSYESIISAFASELDVRSKNNTAENILSEIFNLYHDLGKKAPFLLIEIDEFGKFLEYAAKNNPEKELYFIQQLAEFVNNPKHNILLLTTIHQSFESYAFSLASTQRQEWVKVKGRFKEITFNEPVEQLVFLASEHIKNTEEKKPNKDIGVAYDLFLKSKAFNFNVDFSKEISLKIFPLDLFAANVLTLSLQKYGQNERSLFSFLEGTDNTSLAKFDSERNCFYNLANVYDYLNFNFYSFLTSRYNPDFSSWSAIRSALDKVERSFDGNLNAYGNIIKSIGLLNIYTASGAVLDHAFITNYCQVCLGISNGDELVNDLAKKKVLLYRRHSQRYILFEGTDLDIQSALIEAGNKIEEITDVKTILERHYELPPILAKQHSYRSGTPRYFKFVISEEPISEVPIDEIDGFINLIFNEGLTLKRIKEESSIQKEAILYGFYRNSKEIKTLLYEIEKSQRVLIENDEDKVAKRELQNIIFHQKNLLNHYIINNLFGDRTEVTWIWNGEEIKLNSRKQFNGLLSQICEKVYDYAPIFNNELVNKHKISPAISSSKKLFFNALVNRWDQEDLGFAKEKFPAEKTIYITLLKENGLSPFTNELKGEVNVSTKSSFKRLWKACVNFLTTAKEERKNLTDLVTLLRTRPFKLKQGLIDFWIPTFLFLKRDDFALFGRNGFIPEINEQTLDLISKNPDEFWIKTFNIEGVKLNLFNSYRLFLNQETKQKLTNNTFIETIKPFLVFYKQLPDYSKNTKRMSPEAIAIRKAIINAKDPEKSFFEDFPSALGTSLNQLKNSKKALHDYIETLQSSIREIRTSYDGLIDRFEGFLVSEILYDDCPFEEYKLKLQNRFRNIKRHLLLSNQKTLVLRIDSSIDDRKAWLSSICYASIGKPLESLSDEDEILLYGKFKSQIIELDAFTSLSEVELDETKEDLVSFEMGTFDGIIKSSIRIPKRKAKDIRLICDSLKSSLTKDRSLNISALATVLKELLKND
jgi:hypothetical protein